MSERAGRGPRADALRNRARLLAAASNLFVERGPDVPYIDIAKEAGVGVGTIYRHFPTREALIEAAYRSELDAVCEAAPELLGSLPPEQALRTWMDRFIDYMTTKIGMGEAIRAVMTAGGNPYAQSRDRLDAALETLLAATVEAGRTRIEIEADDVLMSLSGIAMAAGAPDQREQASRMIDLLFEGLRRHD
ncbi:TetR family transcriptional regulator [Planotetraspora thailandica]|uniref:TetR family transcriptional regulator n=1 Tax=Planotetraspora thailandica TaxID=487172 RepID=A0A8J3XYX2_9ACTN|nr:TetR/AcrR family transcriptional regulator [Planotetraspora thailandica]GII57966.1 TetR family transcriptional regulator [Planotetraspora thailandica]